MLTKMCSTVWIHGGVFRPEEKLALPLAGEHCAPSHISLLTVRRSLAAGEKIGEARVCVPVRCCRI